MISGFPSQHYKTFESKLRDTGGDTKFEKLKNYCEAIPSGDIDLKGWSIDDRLRDSKFFYYPYESDMPARGKTCFEKSTHLLMAVRELYPESEPKMAYVDEGKRGTHSMVLFNHDGALWGGDPNYSLFNPVYFSGKNIMVKDSDKKIRYRSLSFLTDSELGSVISGLRGICGIDRFLSEGGQRVLESPNSFRPYNVFMKYENGKLVSDLRFDDFDLRHNTAVRRNFDFDKDEFGIEFLTYRRDNWAELVGARKIAWSGNNGSIGGRGTLINKFANVDQMKEWGVDNFVKQFFTYHKGVLGIAKDKHKSRDKVFYLSKSGREEVRLAVNKDVRDYLASLPESFAQHVVDYIYYQNSDGIVPALMGDKSAKNWKDFKVRGRNIYAKEFAHTIYSASRAESRRAVGLNQRVVDELKFCELFKNIKETI